MGTCTFLFRLIVWAREITRHHHKTNDNQRQMTLCISLLTADHVKSESNSRWNSDAHNFGNFATFAKLLDCVCVLHVVHGDSVDHYDSVIFPGEERETQTP